MVGPRLRKPLDHGVGEASRLSRLSLVHGEHRGDRPFERPPRRALPQAFGEEQRRCQEGTGRIRNSEACNLGGVAEVRREQARAALGQPGARDRAQAPGEMRGSVDDRAGEVAGGDDQVDRPRVVAEARQHAAQGHMLDLEAVPAVCFCSDQFGPFGRGADGGEARPPRRGELEGAWTIASSSVP